MDDSRSDDPPTGGDGGLGRRWQQYLDEVRTGEPPEPDPEPPDADRPPSDTERPPSETERQRPRAGDASLRDALRGESAEPEGPPLDGSSRHRWILVAAVIVLVPIGLFVLARQGGWSGSADSGSPAPTELAAAADGPVAADSPEAEATADPSREEATDAATTPEFLDLTVRGSPTLEGTAGDGGAGPGWILSVPAGTVGRLAVNVRDDGRPAPGVPIVLRGSEALPDLEGRLVIETDSAGSAVFYLPVGNLPDTVSMEILARGFWLRGTNRVALRVVP